MKMRILLLLLCLSFSSPALAQGYPITEHLSFIERVLQQVTDELSNFDFDDILGYKKEELDAQNPAADGNPAVNDNASSMPVSELPPYADEKLRAELSKDKPSIPAVNTIIKDTLTFKSETAEKEDEVYLKSGDFDVNAKTTSGSVKPDKSESTENTLEKQQMYSTMVYANARALARRTLDLIAKVEQDTQVMENEKNHKSSTGSLYKTTAASLIYRTHMLLNELATLRNSYIEIKSIDTMQGNELLPSETDKIKDTIKGAVGSV